MQHSLEYTGYMMDLQFIEESLRCAIGHRLTQLSKLAVDHGGFHFSPNVKYLERQTLQKLIVEFSQYCTDEALLSQLNAIVPIRNELAHKILLSEESKRLPAKCGVQIANLLADLQQFMELYIFPTKK